MKTKIPVFFLKMDENDEQNEEIKESKKKKNPVDPTIQCLFSRKICKRKRLKGFDFCHKHILEDKNSPFQQCSFIIKSTEERCINPAPKSDNRKTFCLIHTRDPKLKRAHDEIMRRNLKRKQDQRRAAAEARKAASEASLSSATHKSSTDPKRPRDEESEQFAALEMPEADGIYALQDNCGKRYDVAWFGENDSDAESVDSEEEDVLRHAGVWTLEEALKTCRDKMIRKRSLYLDQYKRLHALLRERRRRHLIRVATSSYQSDQSTLKDNQGERPLTLSEQRALELYQHLKGTELLLERQAKEKRTRGNIAPKLLPQNRCHHFTDQERCQNKVLPFAKFCLQHICSDPDQRLYKKCTFEPTGSNPCCMAPVSQAFRITTCDLHAATLPRFSSEALENIINPVSKSSDEPEETPMEVDPPSEQRKELETGDSSMKEADDGTCVVNEKGKAIGEGKKDFAEGPANQSEETFQASTEKKNLGSDMEHGATERRGNEALMADAGRELIKKPNERSSKNIETIDEMETKVTSRAESDLALSGNQDLETICNEENKKNLIGNVNNNTLAKDQIENKADIRATDGNGILGKGLTESDNGSNEGLKKGPFDSLSRSPVIRQGDKAETNTGDIIEEESRVKSMVSDDSGISKTEDQKIENVSAKETDAKKQLKTSVYVDSTKSEATDVDLCQKY